MKKIALIIIAAITLNLAVFYMPIASAGSSNSIMDYKMQFIVTENLKLGGAGDSSQQAATYFGSKTPLIYYITKIIEYATYIIGSIAMILVIVSGFMFMFSYGNTQKLDEAKDVFKYAAIGLIIVFLSYLITIFAQSIFVSAK